MCTLIAMWRYHPSAPLILGLNRDEFLSRPTAPTAFWEDADPAKSYVGGKDLLSGGTWFGVGRKIVAALTNHRAGERSRPGERTRGELVTHCLGLSSLAEVRRELSKIPARSFGYFHLLVCDGESLIWATNRSGEMEITEIASGLHVLGNYGLDNETDPVVATLHKELNGSEKLSPIELKEKLATVLSHHGPGWPCVHLGPYGTRSSAMLWWGKEDAALWTTDGPPCESRWQDQSRLLIRLGETV